MRRTTLFLVAFAVLCLFSMSLMAAEDGAALYQKSCASCHGADGGGKTPAQKKLSIPDLHEKQFVEMSDKEMFETIGRGTKHKSYPHSFLYTGMNEQQVTSIVAHIRKLQKSSGK